MIGIDATNICFGSLIAGGGVVPQYALAEMAGLTRASLSANGNVGLSVFYDVGHGEAYVECNTPRLGEFGGRPYASEGAVPFSDGTAGGGATTRVSSGVENQVKIWNFKAVGTTALGWNITVPAASDYQSAYEKTIILGSGNFVTFTDGTHTLSRLEGGVDLPANKPCTLCVTVDGIYIG